MFLAVHLLLRFGVPRILTPKLTWCLEKTPGYQYPTYELKQKRAESSVEQTVKHALYVLRGTWKNAKSLGYHVSEIDFPKIKVTNGKTRYMSDEEVQRLFDELNPLREDMD